MQNSRSNFLNKVKDDNLENLVKMCAREMEILEGGEKIRKWIDKSLTEAKRTDTFSFLFFLGMIIDR